jgi:branched-chain amino acid transport system permease protein
MGLALAWQTVVNGWVTTFSYAVLATGLALIFGVARLANFAWGEFFMIGAYMVWLLYTVGGLPFPVALLGAMGAVCGMGLVTEVAIFRRLRGNIPATFMAATGLIYILQVFAGQMWGLGRTKPVLPPIPGSLEIFGASVGWQRVVIIPAGIAMIGGLWLFLHRVKLGQALRATSQDAEAAALQGINPNRMALLAMGIASAFAGAAGALLSPIYSVTPYMGTRIILMVFIIVVFGGVGSIEGAFLASVILGFIYAVVTTLADSTIATIISAWIMALVLAFRPQGLLGREKA